MIINLNAIRLFIFGFIGITSVMTGCVYYVPYPVETTPPQVQISTINKKLPVTAEEARRLYDAQVQQRTINNPFEDEQPASSQNSKPKVIRQSNSTPPSNLKCGSYPRTCSQMTSCSQARAALKCGNTRLDRDGDGIPCETICGG
ncbi:excalibur calcium-binding domain-containing protein [Acinetobacter sp. 243_ASPC]|uniref:excalibur calcium-binding domain-containing protein n=1 Tax=Acinetobacter sp. 243_ASPC TaxID=1579345 RepID=UPI000660DA8E|nr:excalibur calcium-binding domain-containing protein [Acinetobacter sp. 243_ASPC]